MAITREMTGSPKKQGVNEEIAYTVDTTNWGSTPTNISVVVKDMTQSGALVTADVMPSGSASANGNVITLPVLKSLVDLHVYRVEVKFTAGGNVFEPYAMIQAEQ